MVTTWVFLLSILFTGALKTLERSYLVDFTAVNI